MLLFADDTVLFFYAVECLQNLLNKMSMYCKSWSITVNTDKTVVILCKEGNMTPYFDVFYDNRKLKVVETFTYLGVTISSNGRLY